MLPARRRPASTSATGYVNPVYRSDFPDPSVLRVGGTYHAYGTQGGGANIQTLTSGRPGALAAGPDALPSWAAGR